MKHTTQKRTVIGKNITLQRKALRASKYATVELDLTRLVTVGGRS